MNWKIFKNYIPVLVGIIIIGGLLIWMSRCGDRKTINYIVQDDKEKEERYQHEINEYESVLKKLWKMVKHQDKKIADAKNKFNEAEKIREKTIYVPVNPEKLKNLSECKGKLTDCQAKLTATENSLLMCKDLSNQRLFKMDLLRKIIRNKNNEIITHERRIEEQKITFKSLKNVRNPWLRLRLGVGLGAYYRNGKIHFGVIAGLFIVLTGLK